MTELDGNRKIGTVAEIRKYLAKFNKNLMGYVYFENGDTTRVPGAKIIIEIGDIVVSDVPVYKEVTV